MNDMKVKIIDILLSIVFLVSAYSSILSVGGVIGLIFFAFYMSIAILILRKNRVVRYFVYLNTMFVLVVSCASIVIDISLPLLSYASLFLSAAIHIFASVYFYKRFKFHSTELSIRKEFGYTFIFVLLSFAPLLGVDLLRLYGINIPVLPNPHMEVLSGPISINGT